jgi:hypothetical protein
VLAVVLVVAALEQTTRPNEAYRDQLADGYRSDARFFGDVERRLGGGEVFQLPAVRFPEFGSMHRMSDYDHARGYLHTSENVRWSYGAQKGRPEDWTVSIEYRPNQQIAAAAVAAGFDGVYVDRAAYPDSALGLEEELRQLLQVAPIVSSDQRLAFYDARPFADVLRRAYSSAELEAVRVATLRPLQVSWSDGFYGPESNGTQEWRWGTRRASIGLEADGARRVVSFRAILTNGHVTPYPTTIRYPDGHVETLAVSTAGVTVERQFELRPGVNLVELETAAPPSPKDPADARELHLRVLDPSITEPAAEAFSPEGLRRRVPLVHFADGWSPPERDYEAGRPFRWMGTSAKLLVTRGGQRTGLGITFPAASFAQPRTLTARLGGEQLARVRIPTGPTKRVLVPIPPGRGDATVELAVVPAAQPAAPSGVQAARLLALKVDDIAVTKRP